MINQPGCNYITALTLQDSYLNSVIIKHPVSSSFK